MPDATVMGPNDWIEVVILPESEGSSGEAWPLFGFNGQVEGLPFRYEESTPLLESVPFLRALGFSSVPERLLSKDVSMLLAQCAALHAPEMLRGLGFEVDPTGKVRVGSLSLLEGFGEWASALEAEEREAHFQKSLRSKFKDSDDEKRGPKRLIGFERHSFKRWMFLRTVSPAQVRVAPQVLDAIKRRLEMSQRPGGSGGTGSGGTGGGSGRAREDPFWELLAVLAELATHVNALISEIPESKRRAAVEQWIGRLRRWFPRVLNALRAPSGRAALMKLFMAIAFPRQRPTPEQMRELLEAMGPEAEDVLDMFQAQARHDELYTLCRSVLKKKFGKLSLKTKATLLQGSSTELKRWIIRAQDARRLADVFKSRSSSPTGATPRPPPRPRGRSGPRANRKK